MIPQEFRFFKSEKKAGNFLLYVYFSFLYYLYKQVLRVRRHASIKHQIHIRQKPIPESYGNQVLRLPDRETDYAVFQNSQL